MWPYLLRGGQAGNEAGGWANPPSLQVVWNLTLPGKSRAQSPSDTCNSEHDRRKTEMLICEGVWPLAG